MICHPSSAELTLLRAIQTFVADCPLNEIQRFKPAIANWGERWCAVEATDLPAAQTLVDALSLSAPSTHRLLAAFANVSAQCRWEQSYKKADGLVGDDMLAGYGFIETIGKWGPFISDRVRSGIGVWGPNVLYPRHHHAAEELYLVLAGTAQFDLGEGDQRTVAQKVAGEAVYVPPNLVHGLRTTTQPLVVFYIWQAGDLRETSTFPSHP